MGRERGGDAFEISTITVDDVSAMAGVHVDSFPGSALSRLGPEAVRRYYEWQYLGPHQCRAWGAFSQGRLVGFCLGGVFRGAMGGFLWRNRRFLLRRVLTRPWLMLDPLFREKIRVAWHLVKRLSIAFVGKGEPAADIKAGENLRPFAILSVCVDPRLQRSGVGRGLMDRAEGEARALGFREMALTVRADNRKAIGFYEALGWEGSPTARPDTVAMRKTL